MLGSGKVNVLFDRPLVDNEPIAMDAVPAGPRDYEWRSDAPATLAFVEAADGGDPNAQTAVHDRVKILEAPFKRTPRTLLEVPMRVREIDWGNEHLAVATEARWSDRHIVILTFDPTSASPEAVQATILYEGSYQDRYHSPGQPFLVPNASGNLVLKLTMDKKGIFFSSPGASPGGDKPFVAVMPMDGGVEKVVYRSADPF